jgi:hypothetical protein
MFFILLKKLLKSFIDKNDNKAERLSTIRQDKNLTLNSKSKKNIKV